MQEARRLAHDNRLEGKTVDELDELEDEEDEAFLEQYRYAYVRDPSIETQNSFHLTTLYTMTVSNV